MGDFESFERLEGVDLVKALLLARGFHYRLLRKVAREIQIILPEDHEEDIELEQMERLIEQAEVYLEN